jgi:hypothetical protein
MFVEPITSSPRPDANRKLARVLLGALGFLWVIPAWAQTSLVHVTPCGPGAFPGTTCPIPATAAGNLLVIGWQIGGSANTSTRISTITDNANNSYAEAGAAMSIDAGPGSANDIWYAKNVAAGATSITLTPSAAVTNAGVVIWEIAGADPNSPLDTTAILNSQPANATSSGAPVTTTATGDVIISLIVVANSVTGMASGNAFTNDSLLKSNGWAHLIASGQGVYTPQWTQSPAGTYASSTAAFRAAAAGGTGSSNTCDLNSDGLVNNTDVNLAINMALGAAPCTARVEGPLTCTVITIQRVVNASAGQACVTYNAHGVTLNWMAGGSSNVVGYNIYRSTTSGGPYTKLNSSAVIGTSYSDQAVQAGLTYFYVATSLDVNGNESAYSGQATAVIPTP